MIKPSELNPATHSLIVMLRIICATARIAQVSKIYLFLPHAGKVGFVMNPSGEMWKG